MRLAGELCDEAFPGDFTLLLDRECVSDLLSGEEDRLKADLAPGDRGDSGPLCGDADLLITEPACEFRLLDLELLGLRGPFLSLSLPEDASRESSESILSVTYEAKGVRHFVTNLAMQTRVCTTKKKLLTLLI